MYQLHQTLVSIIKLTRLVFGNLIKIEYFKQVVIYHKKWTIFQALLILLNNL